MKTNRKTLKTETIINKYLFLIDLVSYLMRVLWRIHALYEVDVLVAEHVEKQLEAVGGVGGARDVQLRVQPVRWLLLHAKCGEPLLHAARWRRCHLQTDRLTYSFVQQDRQSVTW